MVDKLFKYRYAIAGVVLIILVLFKINFSSMDAWRGFLGESQEKSNIIGRARSVRSDEWLVQTPMMLAQAISENGYEIYNEHVAQGHINLLMTSAVVDDIVTISRPLTWGFLVLGAEYGYSFYWSLKLIALIMVSIELAYKISKKDKLLAITGGLMLGLAPTMLWWMSTAVTEAYIFGVAVIVLFSYYMENLDWAIWKKLLIGLGIIICLPAFVFTLYPAYQVPFAFVMGLFMIIDFVKHRKELTKTDYIIMSGTIIISLAVLARMILLSWDGIKTMLSTVYPGSRFETGGNYTINDYVSYFINIFLPFTNNTELNASELSSYIFPFVGLVTLLIMYLKDIKQDKDTNKPLIIGLSIIFVILILWEFVGFPRILARITLLYFSTAKRANIVLGLVGTLLTIMMMKKVSETKAMDKKQAFAIGVAVSILSWTLAHNLSYASFFNLKKSIILVVIMFCMTYFLLAGNKKIWCLVMCGISVLAGLYINPLVSGLDVFYNTEISHKIQEIKKEDENAVWIGRHNLSGQYLVANGINCVNGVHIYPNFEWLKIVDPEGKYNEIYNRYAHIGVILGDEVKFEQLGTDIYNVYLPYEKLKELNVKYYYTNTELEEKEQEKFHLTIKYENKDKAQYIYQIN